MERGTVIGEMSEPQLTSSTPGQTVQAGVLQLAQPGEAWADGARLCLSPREFAVLWELASRPGHIVTREDLFAAVWGGAMSYRDRSVDVHVRRLRQKLADAAPAWLFIHTHHRWGYGSAARVGDT